MHFINKTIKKKKKKKRKIEWTFKCISKLYFPLFFFFEWNKLHIMDLLFILSKHMRKFILYFCYQKKEAVCIKHLIYIYNNRWSREKLKLEFLIRVLILCHVSRSILLIVQFKSEIEVQFCSIIAMLTLRSPPLLEICILHLKMLCFFSFLAR